MTILLNSAEEWPCCDKGRCHPGVFSLGCDPGTGKNLHSCRSQLLSEMVLSFLEGLREPSAALLNPQ